MQRVKRPDIASPTNRALDSDTLVRHVHGTSSICHRIVQQMSMLTGKTDENAAPDSFNGIDSIGVLA